MQDRQAIIHSSHHANANVSIYNNHANQKGEETNKKKGGKETQVTK